MRPPSPDSRPAVLWAAEARKAALQTIEIRERIVLTAEESRRFVEALLAPPRPPTERMKRAPETVSGNRDFGCLRLESSSPPSLQQADYFRHRREEPDAGECYETKIPGKRRRRVRLLVIRDHRGPTNLRTARERPSHRILHQPVADTQPAKRLVPG